MLVDPIIMGTNYSKNNSCIKNWEDKRIVGNEIGGKDKCSYLYIGV